MRGADELNFFCQHPDVIFVTGHQGIEQRAGIEHDQIVFNRRDDEGLAQALLEDELELLAERSEIIR